MERLLEEKTETHRFRLTDTWLSINSEIAIYYIRRPNTSSFRTLDLDLHLRL